LLIGAMLIATALHVTARARSLQPGELVVLTITAPAGASAIHVRAFDRDISSFPLKEHVWSALVGIDLDVPPRTYVVTVDAEPGAAHATYDLIVAPRQFRTRRLTVDPDFVTPPSSVVDRINREAALLAATWRTAAAEKLWTEPFVRPVPQPANSAFGTRSIFNGTPRNAHSGADFMSPAGTRIRAPNAGRIVIARDLYFSGKTVVIDHGLGLFSTLAHLSEFEVREGDHVAAGEIVGRVGATGRVTGPHLHWAVRAGDARVDPLSVLAVLGARQRKAIHSKFQIPNSEFSEGPTSPGRRARLRWR
jgi:hypothetical protein